MNRILLTLTALLLGVLTPALAHAETRSICAYDPAGRSGEFFAILFFRELPGTLLVLGYFIALPPLLALTVLRSYYQRMGLIRFMLMANLLLFMASLPIKMVLRWVFNLKYLISIPEYFFNF